MCLRVLRFIAISLAVISLGLAARPVLAQDFSDPIPPDVSPWWVQAAAEDTPEKKFHLLPFLEDSEKPRDWVGLTRDTALRSEERRVRERVEAWVGAGID